MKARFLHRPTPNYSPIFINNILGAEPPGKASTGDAPHRPAMFPTNRENVTIRAPVDRTHRSRRGVCVHIWHAKNLGLRGVSLRRETRNFNQASTIAELVLLNGI